MSNPQPKNLKYLSVVNDSDIKVRSKLAEYRKARGYSQDDLAKLTGLTKTTIQNWENGRNTVYSSLFGQHSRVP